MNFILNNQQKKAIEKSLSLTTEFSKVNFQPYFFKLTEYHKLDDVIKNDIELLFLKAQKDILKTFKKDRVLLNQNARYDLTSLNKVKSNNFDFHEEELYSICLATESLKKIACGQLDFMKDLLLQFFTEIDVKSFHEVSNCFDKANNQLKIKNKFTEEAEVAWEVNQLIRDHIALKRK